MRSQRNGILRREKPPPRVIKINIDGSISGARKEAKCGGVKRDEHKGDEKRPTQGYCQNLIEACEREMRKFESMKLKHILQEQNKSAYALARLIVLGDFEPKCFVSPPPSVISILMEEKQGIQVTSDLTMTH
nr:uncharacterized protein LOC109159944 [Ipomoea batatas]GMD47081.1 uncharacterized protein LOC109159944 [Ipomoea batatas]